MNSLVHTSAGTAGADAVVGTTEELCAFAVFYYGFAYLDFTPRTGAT